MTKKRDKSPKRRAPQDKGAPAGLSRRDFFKAGAVAGVGGAAVLSAPGMAQAQSTVADISWDYEADIVVVGGGATGLPAAIRARDLGATVIVIDQNYIVGGRMQHSGGWVSMGGGDAIQERDRKGEDPEGLGLADPLYSPADLTDDPERLFTDMTDWSVMGSSGVAHYRYNDREQHRGWADNAVPARQLLLDNYVRFSRIYNTHQGGGMTRARSAISMMKLADVTDIKAGTISREDLGSNEEERSTAFNASPTPETKGERAGAPGWFTGGFTLARYLEFSAREKGIQFMLFRHMDEIIREEQFAGRVLGVKASYTPRFNPETGERLEWRWRNGDIDERAETVYIRAKRAVIVGTGGRTGNRELRTMDDPRLSEPSYQYGDSLMGPLNFDGSGILAGMQIGANLAGMAQSQNHRSAAPRLHAQLAVRDKRDALMPGHPAFLFAHSRGIRIQNVGWEHLIAVNQVGKRFYNESAIPRTGGTAEFPPGKDGTKDPFVPLDWRNSSIEHIRANYDKSGAVDAALAMNEGSRAPDFSSGPVWAVFDAAAVERGGWKIRFPYIADPPDGYFFQADTLADLAALVTGNEYQNMPLKYLEETVVAYNAAADSGTDAEFEKPVLHRIDTPPFYAATIPNMAIDSYGGLRINGKAQVVDIWGDVIPGLYAGGDVSGGGQMHGLGRAIVHGYMAGSNA